MTGQRRPQAGWLTARQAAVVRLVADGYSNQAGAAELGMARATFETHLLDARHRLGARNRAHVAALAVRYGIIE